MEVNFAKAIGLPRALAARAQALQVAYGATYSELVKLYPAFGGDKSDESRRELQAMLSAFEGRVKTSVAGFALLNILFITAGSSGSSDGTCRAMRRLLALWFAIKVREAMDSSAVQRMSAEHNEGRPSAWALIVRHKASFQATQV